MIERGARGSYLSWVPYVGRSQSFIDSLGLDALYVHYLRENSPRDAPVKYVLQFWVTLWKLFRTRPRVVFAMNPVPFATVATHLYCTVTGAQYLMDCHSGAFEKRHWKLLTPLQAWYGRRARAVIVTNPAHEEIVRAWGARPLVIGDPPLAIPDAPSASSVRGVELGEPFVFCINRFHENEGVPELLDAARRSPGTRFVVSGDLRVADPAVVAGAPPNVTFTGWLEIDEFWALARAARAFVVLTTQENTILRGGWEAMYLGKPLVTSGTAALQAYFTRGAVFTPTDAGAIADAVADALARGDALAADMAAFRDEKYARWEADRAALEELLDVTFDGPRTA